MIFSDILSVNLNIAQAFLMSKKTVSSKQHIRASFRDAIFTNLNIGLGESYFAAFMLALGISEVISGLGVVIPQFIGVIFQLLSIRSFFTKYSLKRRIIIFLSFQAISLIPLIFAGLLKIKSPAFIIGVLGIYWASLLSLNPPWNRLMGHTVPVQFRLKFFSMRNQIAQFSVFVGLIVSGIVLYYAKGSLELPVYVGIFIIGFILKCLSVYEIQVNHLNYEIAHGNELRVRLRDFLKRLKGTNQGKLISFLFAFYITVYFSSPYFNPYMLGKLKFDYLEYMGIMSIAFFGRVLMYRILQNRARPRHIDKILLISVLGISTTPLSWALWQNFWWIIFIEFLSGMFWAGLELSTILLYYQKIEDRERTSIITYITLLNTSGMLIGSMLGAIFMKILPNKWDQYLVLFTTSSFLRLGVIAFAPQINFKGQIPKLLTVNRILSVRPPVSYMARPFALKSKLKNKKNK